MAQMLAISNRSRNAGGGFPSVFRGKQFRLRHTRGLGIAQQCQPISPCQPQGFNAGLCPGQPRSQHVPVHRLQSCERLQHGQSTSCQRCGVNRLLVPLQAERFHQACLIRRQIGHRHKAIVLLELGGNALSDITSIERLDGVCLGQRFEHLRQFGVLKFFTRRERLTVAEIQLARAEITLELLRGTADRRCEAGRPRKAFARDGNRRLN